MLRCRQCGAEASDWAAHCPRCQADLKGATAIPEPEAVKPSVVQDAPVEFGTAEAQPHDAEILLAPPANHLNRRVVIAGTTAALVLLATFGATLLLRHHRPAARVTGSVVAPAPLRGYTLVYDDGRGIHVVPLNGGAPFAQSDRLPTGTPLATGRSFVFVSGSEAYSITEPFRLPPLPIGPGDALIPASTPGNVGLVQHQGRVAGWEMVSAKGADTGGSFATLLAGYEPIAQVDGGLLVQQNTEGPIRIWKTAPDGTGHFTSTLPAHGRVADARDDLLAWIDDGACGVNACPLHVTSITTGVDRIVQAPPGSDGFLFGGGAFSPDGRHLAAYAGFPPETNLPQQVAVIDLGSMTSTLAGPVQASQSQAAVWTSDGAWVFFCGFPGPLSAFRPSDRRLLNVGVPAACPHFAVF